MRAMGITLADLPELLRLLEQHPEWREALRLVLLGEELTTLPQLMRQLIETQREIVEAQNRHEQQIAQLIEIQRQQAVRMDQMAEEQQRHSREIAEIRAILAEVLEAQNRHEQQIAQLIEIQRQQAVRMDQMAEEQQRHSREIAEIRAILAEVLEVQNRHSQEIADIRAILAEVLEVQNRHSQEIADIRAILAEVLEVQNRHSQEIADIRAILAEVLEVQRQHSQMFVEVLEVQRRHSEMFVEVMEVQRQHSHAIEELRTQIGNLTEALGLNLEEQAEDILLFVMEQKGWRLVRGPYSLALNGQIDLVATYENAEGQPFTVLVEVKMRLSRKAVDAWAHRVRSEGFQKRLRQRGFLPPYYPYVFGFRVDVAADEAARRSGIGLITSRGVIQEPEVIL